MTNHRSPSKSLLSEEEVERIRQKVAKESAERIEQYKTDERYRKEVEEMIQADSVNSYCYRTRAFFQQREGKSKDTLYFPVTVIKGRKMFGKLQCLITPLCLTDNIYNRTPFGQRWVDRKFLVLGHDHEFKNLEKYLPPEKEDE